jgi:beta-N-acetylhexosaminidase
VDRSILSLIGGFAMIKSVERPEAHRRRRREQVRRRRLALACAAALAFLGGLAVGAGGDEQSEPARQAGEAATPAGTAAPPPVDELTLEQQVGQMVILRFAGTSAPGYVREALRDRRAAGVILFRDNVADPQQLRALTRSLRRAGPRSIISVDQEGGVIRNVPWAQPERSAPDQQAWGTVREDAEAAGRDLRAAGINVTLGPVADIPTVEGAAMADRAFTTDPDGMTAAIAESINGWHEGGVATTVKHFPGLGGATVNTDEGSAVIDRTRDQLEDDLQPYRIAVNMGTEYVMVGHATYPALDEEHIASQSPEIVDGLLRRRLGFEGVAMTDSLEAAAVQAVADVEEAAVASARAGIDVILTTGRGSYSPVYEALLSEAREDPEFRERVRESAARVLAAQSSNDG